MRIRAKDFLQKQAFVPDESLKEVSGRLQEVVRTVAYAALLVGELAKMAQTIEDAQTAKEYTKAAALLQEALSLVSSREKPQPQIAGIGV